jgi:hypothetical protein
LFTFFLKSSRCATQLQYLLAGHRQRWHR